MLFFTIRQANLVIGFAAILFIASIVFGLIGIFHVPAVTKAQRHIDQAQFYYDNFQKHSHAIESYQYIHLMEQEFIKALMLDPYSGTAWGQFANMMQFENKTDMASIAYRFSRRLSGKEEISLDFKNIKVADRSGHKQVQ